jgi:hypothetical protein
MSESIIESTQATQVSTTACETVYTFNGREIRLWIITGGIPCLSFNYGPFQERFPIVEKYSDGQLDKNKTNHWNYDLLCFDHQIADKMGNGKVQGPTPEDCFEDGWATFWNFYHSNIRKLELYEKRKEIISTLTNGGVLTSKRKHGKEDHTFMQNFV